MNKPFDRTRFTKVLALAESEHDGEALAAVRKAVAMARAAGLSLGEAVGTDSDATHDLRALTLTLELSAARREIEELRRQLVGRTDEARLDAAHSKGYERGHAAGKAEGAREATMKANHRIRELEAELEAHRPPMDWSDLAESFASENRRGLKVAFAKGIQRRARINQLTPIDQAELRKFSALSERRARQRKKPMEETAKD